MKLTRRIIALALVVITLFSVLTVLTSAAGTKSVTKSVGNSSKTVTITTKNTSWSKQNSTVTINNKSKSEYIRVTLVSNSNCTVKGKSNTYGFYGSCKSFVVPCKSTSSITITTNARKNATVKLKIENVYKCATASCAVSCTNCNSIA